MNMRLILIVCMLPFIWLQASAQDTLTSDSDSPRIATASLYYIDGTRLTRSVPNGNISEHTSIKAHMILDRCPRTGKLLIVDEASPRENVLSLIDTTSGEALMIARDVVRAKLSPSTREIVTWSHTNSIELVDDEGALLRAIADHGAAPVFSHDGQFVAYQKLADIYDDEQESFEYAQGIATYDLRTGVETLVTDHPEDFAPIGFSHDMRVLFFNSTRPYDDDPVNHIASVWSVDLASGVTKRLTNRSSADVRHGIHVPIVDEHALWTSDRRTAISATDSESGVWRFDFSVDGTSVGAGRFADGDAPTWVTQDQSFASRVFENDRSTMRVWSLRTRTNGGK